jgi:hypothetical protein
MKLETNSMTAKKIRLADLAILLQNLDVIGIIRFLQYGDMGHGNYTREGHKWLGNPDFGRIVEEIKSAIYLIKNGEFFRR